ncbi:MAG: LUD domain-containing protein, partial [Bacteroidales bacterium]|nr:LUD domain-containing protein [Bacteroidales bacterium]
MALKNKKNYLEQLQTAVHNDILKQALAGNVSKVKADTEKALHQFSDLRNVKARAAYLKLKVLEELDRFLIQFENQFTAAGGKVLWANDSKEAQEKVLALINEYPDATVIRAQSKVCEEIGLCSFLEKKEIPFVTGDSVLFFSELLNETNTHPVLTGVETTPEQVIEEFRKRYFSEEEHSTPQAITHVLRRLLVEKCTDKEIVITGADFLACDTGSVSISADTGDLWLAASEAKLHIVVTGIDRLIPSVEDVDLLWPLFSSSAGTGTITPVNTLFSGPRRHPDVDGPNEMVVIFVNNGRSELLANNRLRKILTCIHCGACLNFCPVYSIAGEAAYQSVYLGPYGIIASQAFQKIKDLSQLNYTTTLCGECSRVCPVGINLHELIIYNRRELVKNGNENPDIKRFIRGYKYFVASRRHMNLGTAGIKNMILRNQMEKYWGQGRTIPKVAPKNFSQ